MNSRLGLQALPETLRLVAVGLGISILAFCGVSRSDPVNSQGELIVFSLQPADDETSPDSFGYAPDTILLQLRIDGPGLRRRSWPRGGT